jgi:DNA processing protein
VGRRDFKAGYCGRELGASDPGYPVRLRALETPPDRVFVLGPWDHPGPHVAIVGARNASEDGIDVTRHLARTLAEEGIAVVSGLARGIDAAAHEGALDAGGVSGAVLGTSLEETYPREHADLQSRLSRSLGLMSEIPPGKSATRSTFAARNRLLAAIADVVVVVQGGKGSGSLITAEAAVRLRRPVGALPWDSRDPLGEAPHELIRSGIATLVRDADDVLELIRESRGDARTRRSAGRERSGSGATGPGARSVSRVAPELLAPHEAALYSVLRNHPRPLDDLAQAASLSVSELSVALLTLELSGLALRMPGGLVRRTRRP